MKLKIMQMESKFNVVSNIRPTNSVFSKKCTTLNKFLFKRKIQNTQIPTNKISNIVHNGELNNVITEISRDLKVCNKQNKAQIFDQRKSLPVYCCRHRIIQEIRRSDTLVLMSETGSGKTTQIPQFLKEEGFSEEGIIGITQPRRVAAITVAKRVAQEQGCALGTTVGYTVRFEDCTSEQTCIKFMTDGFLLREALSDPLLLKYSVLMLDEAHERTINTDVLFGIVKTAQSQRRCKKKSLKVIITSATMDIDQIGQYFGVKGMYLEGRLHPVRVMHAKEPQPDYLHAALVTIFDIHRNLPMGHDILVFLTGQEEIENLAQQIRKIAKTNAADIFGLRVFPLYASLPQYKQLESFLPSPPTVRKIILATNIAETSLTIPGIKCVVDCGFVKSRIYNPNNNLDILRIVRISQANAWQRCGRAGRDSPGICYRIYTHTEMCNFDNVPKPEILRSNLTTVVLHLLALGIDTQTFDFLNRPKTEIIDSAYEKLKGLGAVEIGVTPKLTSLGYKMSQFPLDPRLSKLILSASNFGCLNEVLSLVAMLSGENLFLSSVEKSDLVALAHLKFQSKFGDHLTLLNLYNAFEQSNNVKIWCHDNFLNQRNLLYARKVRNQLLEIANRMHLRINSCGENLDSVRKCLLAGFFDNLAKLQRDNFYITLNGRLRAKIHPSSVFHGKYRPLHILYTEIVFTENNYLRQVTEINPEWITDISSYK